MSTTVLDQPLPETAKCRICKSVLEFGVGQHGVSLERCSNRRCLNHAPHRPQPDSLDLPRRAMHGFGARRKRA